METSYIFANGKKIATLTEGHKYFQHTDHLGSTSVVTGETGRPVEEIGYLPFGATLFRNVYHGGQTSSFYKEVTRLPTHSNAEDIIKMLLNWRHSNFNVFCGTRIYPGEEEVMEDRSRHIIPASFSQERMSYIPNESKVVYKSKDGKEDE